MKQYFQMSSKSFDKATREWVQIRKKLYLQIKSEVQRLLAGAWKEFLPLERRYSKELAQPWRAVTKDLMYRKLVEAELILMGDFHALQQSQRGHLRILRDWPEPKQLVLAVEFFQARHQKIVDQYLKGQLTEAQFLKKISWQRTWGFQWDHYKPILEWAQKNRVPVYGINWGIRLTAMHSIKTRENFSAVCIKKIQMRHPGHKLVVIYGDLHLSKSQLPHSIKKQEGCQKIKMQRIFQNYEPLYFRALAQGIESKIELIQFRSGDFCVQSVPPWVKWQSYLLFLENTLDRQLDEFDGDVDQTDHVAKLVEFLAAEFKMKFQDNSLAVYTADDTQVYARIRQALHRREWSVVKQWMTEQRSFYVPELQVGYLGRLTVNHTAALAGEFTHALLSKRKLSHFSGLKDFERQIWIQAMAYLGSKIINHNRKTNSFDDLRRSLLGGTSKDENRQVLLLSLHQKVREISFLTIGKLVPIKKTNRTDVTYIDSARLLGAMLGEKIYTLYRTQRWTLLDLLKVLKFRIEEKNFKTTYYQILKKVARNERCS
jgi:hypothetical protein